MAKAAGTDLQSMTALATGFRDLSLAADEQARAAAARQAAPPAPTSIAAGSTPAAPDGVPAAGGGHDAGDHHRRHRARIRSGARPVGRVRHAGDRYEGRAVRGETGRHRAAGGIAQALPRATDITVPLGGPQTILLDIVIDETGHVEKAEVRRSVNRLYETQLVAATRGWRYTPATQGGRPVKYARTLEVTLNPKD